MILTVVGKPGGGKSFYSLKNIARVLAETEQSVVTNLSVDVPALEAYIAKQYPHRVIDVSKRVRLLDEKQAAKFWLFRLDSEGNYHNLAGVSRDDEKQGKRVDYASITDANAKSIAAGKGRVFPGIFYVIDECHVFFDARSWAETGLSLTFYNSQHRKLDDDVMFVTQFLELIDKRVKGFSQEFIYLRNNGAEKIFTLFRGPSYFSAKHYQRPPTGMQDLPSEVHRFTLDLDLAKCYDTSAGVGIKGVGKPEAKKKKGLHAGWLLLPFAAVIAFLFLAPDYLAKAAIGTQSGNYTAKTLGITQQKPGAGVSPAAVDEPATPRAISPAVGGFSVSIEAPPYPTGYLRTNTRVIVQMSDGTWLSERDAELQRIERNSVFIDGKKQFIRSAPRPSPPLPAPVGIPAEPLAPALPAPSPSLGNGSEVETAQTPDASTGLIGKPSGNAGRSTYRL